MFGRTAAPALLIAVPMVQVFLNTDGGTIDSMPLVLAGVGTMLVAALQAVGDAAGNMICVHNVVAASAVVGLTDREGDVIRMTLIPMAYYVVQAGLIGMAMIYGGIWWALALVWLAGIVTAMAANRGRERTAVAAAE